MMPSSNMWSNTWRVILSFSGDRRLVRPVTGGPVVVMWWVTACSMGCSVLQGWVTAGNSARIVSMGLLGSSVGLGDVLLDMIPLPPG